MGRAISEAEARNMEQRIRETMRRLAVDNPQAWGALSLEQRLERAATAAGDQLVTEAHLKRTRIAKTVAAHDRITAYTETQVAHGEDATRLDALERMLAPKNDGKNHIQSVESQTNGLVAYSMGRLVDAWETISPRFLGLFRNTAAEEAMVLELHGTPTGRPEMAKAAKTFHDLAEELRLRYVDAGGQVGKLDNWGMPHAWSQRRVLKVGREAFVDNFMRWIDRSRYVHEDGRLFSDPEMREFLGHAWLTVATDGANAQGNVEHVGGRIKANRHAAHRQLHFTDGQAALEATRSYSERNLFQTLAGHVQAMARDIALVETFGPNSDLAIRHHLDQFYREAAVATPGREGRYAAQAERITNLYNYVAGNRPPPAHHGLANAAQDVRNILSAALLGSAPITSITDEGTVYLTAKVNHLPLHQVFLNEVRAFNLFDRTEKRLAMRAGLLVDTMTDEVNRFAAERAGPRFSAKLSNAFIRLSGLSGMTEARRRAFSVTMMDTIGHLTRQVETLEALDPSDYRILLSKGLTDADWKIWRAAQPEAWRGNDTVLTADAIMRVPDEHVAHAIEPTTQAMRAEAVAQIAELTKRNAQEHTWLSKRTERLASYRAKLAKILRDFSLTRDAKIEKTREYGDMRVKLIEAQNERIAAEADIDAYLLHANETKQIVDTLWSIRESTWGQTEQAISRTVHVKDAAAAKRGEIGQRLGERLGESKRRIMEIESTLARLQRDATSEIKQKMEELDQRFSGAMDETADWYQRMQQRVERRNLAMQSIAGRLNSTISQEVRVARQRAATKLLGLVLEEQDLAVIDPGARERAAMTAGTRSGTIKGELVRSFFLFKSFPFALLKRHWERGLKLYDGIPGKAGYLATLISLQTILGALALEINDVVSGRDPRGLLPDDERWKRAWVAAFLKGGALGLYGDFLFNETTAGNRSLIATTSGPVGGLIESTDDLLRGNIIQAMRGEDTHAGAEAVRFAKGLTPGGNLWYAKAAMDHLVFQELQEYMSPGYLARQKARAQRLYGTSYWWAPGDPASEARAPDLRRVVDGR
jgi:hypothetical protein